MQKLIKIRQKKNRVDGIIEIGDKMKKYITPILCSICLGFFMGFFLCNQYEGKVDLKTVFSESEPLYFLQSGVYSSLESMQENVANLSNYIYTEEAGKYYVYIGITSSEANVDKLKGIYVKYDKVKWTKYLLVIPFAYFFMMSANALVSILTLYMPESMVGTYDNTKEILNNSSYFMLIITTAIIAPISEEFMHRGVVYNRFKRICPPVLAAIISSIIFGIIHMNFVQGPYAFLVGLAAVYVYERYKSIIAPIILHVTANSVSTIVSIIANETGLDTSAASQYNTVQLTASYLQMAIVFGILALIIGIIIYKTVIPNEIKEIK